MNWSALVSSHILVLEYISSPPGSIGGNTPIANTGLHNPKQGTQVWVVFQTYNAYFPLCNTIIMYYRKSSLERALSMPDSSTPRSIKSITWMSIIDPSSYPQTQPHIQVLLKFEWILFKILRILTTWTAASQASQARSLSSGEILDTWIFFSGKDIKYTFINLNGCSCRLQTI